MLDAGNIREKDLIPPALTLILHPHFLPILLHPIYDFASITPWSVIGSLAMNASFWQHSSLISANSHVLTSTAHQNLCPGLQRPGPKYSYGSSGQTVLILTKKVEIHSLPHLIMVLSSSKRKNTALQALVLQPGAGSTNFWPIPGQPLRVPCQVIPPNKWQVIPERIVELAGPPPDECRAPQTEWGHSEGSWASYIQWLRVPGSQKMLNMCGMYKCMNLICRPPTACTPSPKLGMTRA